MRSLSQERLGTEFAASLAYVASISDSLMRPPVSIGFCESIVMNLAGRITQRPRNEESLLFFFLSLSLSLSLFSFYA